MGRRSETGGVRPKGDRIQFDITYQGKRLRPTINMKPTQANLAYARRRHADIVQRIRNGTFDFAEEFPGYKFIDKVAPPASGRPTFRAVAEDWLASVGGELAYSTRTGYRRILEGFWYPRIGDDEIQAIRYSQLARIVGSHPWRSVKTRNNVLSVASRVFEFAHADEIIDRDPTARLKSLKVQKRPPEVYSVEEAEAIIAGIREDWGDFEANYVEWGFFSGARPSETIALNWPDFDKSRGGVLIDKARVWAQDKDTTKTSVARFVECNPRALDVLRRQFALTGLRGENIFGHDTGEPYHDLQVQWRRWRYTHKRLGIRYREPYQMRHTSVSWNLMIGKNILWVAKNHGHSPAVMLKTYADWLEGATDEDIAAIRRAMWLDREETRVRSA